MDVFVTCFMYITFHQCTNFSIKAQHKTSWMETCLQILQSSLCASWPPISTHIVLHIHPGSVQCNLYSLSVASPHLMSGLSGQHETESEWLHDNHRAGNCLYSSCAQILPSKTFKFPRLGGKKYSSPPSFSSKPPEPVWTEETVLDPPLIEDSKTLLMKLKNK